MIAKIVQEQFTRASNILMEKRSCLEQLAQDLLKYETLEGKHVYEIVEHGHIVSEIALPKTANAPVQDKETSTQINDINPTPEVSVEHP